MITSPSTPGWASLFVHDMHISKGVTAEAMFYPLFIPSGELGAIKHPVQAHTCPVHLHDNFSCHLQSGSRWYLTTAGEVIGWPT